MSIYLHIQVCVVGVYVDVEAQVHVCNCVYTRSYICVYRCIHIYIYIHTTHIQTHAYFFLRLFMCM